ncbi:MCE family protein [Nocardioides sp.]|uniref:MCE family protein n=1 Tax=Nocardioides sp. TaxID=35761 RepID=UPI00286ACDF6|nr:MCE family protein [Nocardioides sp.]
MAGIRTRTRTRTRPRREPTRRELAIRGLAVLTTVVVLLGLAYAKVTGSVGGQPEVSAQLRNAGGSLRPGSDVKVRGVIVGRVTRVDRGPDGGVRVDMALREEALGRVPNNVVARILPATVFGTTFVDLVTHGGISTVGLVEGAVIPADRTQGTLELQQALDDIDRLVKALGPAELASAIGSAAAALDGRGEQVGQVIETADAYLARLNPRLPLLRSDLRGLADNLRIVDEIAPDLLQATEDGLVTLDTVVTQQAAITAIISGGTALARSGSDFLDDNRADLVRFVDNAAIVLDAVYDNRRAGIGGSIATNILLGDRFPTTISNGFVRTAGSLRLDAPDYYTRGDRPSYGGGDSSRASSRLDGATFSRMVAEGGR